MQWQVHFVEGQALVDSSEWQASRMVGIEGCDQVLGSGKVSWVKGALGFEDKVNSDRPHDPWWEPIVIVALIPFIMLVHGLLKLHIQGNHHPQ